MLYFRLDLQTEPWIFKKTWILLFW